MAPARWWKGQQDAPSGATADATACDMADADAPARPRGAEEVGKFACTNCDVHACLLRRICFSIHSPLKQLLTTHGVGLARKQEAKVAKQKALDACREQHAKLMKCLTGEASWSSFNGAWY